MTDHIEKAKAALESCDGWPVNGTTDMALLAIANALVAIAEGRGEFEIERRDNPWGGYTEHCGNCGADLGCDTRNVQNFCPNCGRKVMR